MPSIALPVSLRGQLLSGSRFSPLSLFAASEPGVWYDPSDVANLNWRRNLLTFTEQFDNAAWTKVSGVTVSSNTDTAPDGTLTADTLTSGGNQITQNVSCATSTVYTDSLYFKKTTGAAYTPGMYLMFIGGTTTIYAARLDTNTGVATAISAGGFTAPSAVVVSDAGSYWRLSVSGSSLNNTTADLRLYANMNSGGAVDAGSQIIWGAQLELGTVATDYQRISDVNTEVVERFPTATMFQDTAGTTPVTTPGQTVALLLDKSLQQSWVYSSGNVWTKTSGDGVVNVSGSTVTITGATTATTVTRSAGSIPLVAGRARMVVTATWSSATGVQAWLRGSPTPLSNGVQTTLTGALNNSSLERLDVATGSATFVISELQFWAGNHATQATTASRPTYGIVPLGGRRNLLTFSEQFDNAAWTKNASTISVNAATAPDGTVTSDRVIENSGSITNVGVTSPIVGTVAGNIFTTSYTYSVYAKEVSGSAKRYLVIGIGATTRWGYVLANLANGTITQTAVDGIQTNASGTITQLSDGWCRVSVTFSSPLSAGFYTLRTCMSSSPTLTFTSGDIPSYTGDGTSGIFIWGAQQEPGSTATAYQRVTTQYDVTETGVQSLSYLSFDGVDDFMLTGTITAGVDKAQVFAGYRIASGTSSQILLETSSNSSINAGSFALAQGPAAANTGFGAIMNAGVNNIAAQTATLTVPYSSVATLQLNSALVGITNEISLRMNGVAMSLPTIFGTDTGTGNFGSYPLYIGRRAGTSIPFNGNFYSILVRFGANLDAGTITSTETFVAGKTGVTL